LIKSIILNCLIVAGLAVAAQSQTLPAEAKARVDAVVSAAYESATARFPFRLKADGKPKMLRLREVDKCLNGANDSVDWENVSQKLQQIRKEFRLGSDEIISMAEYSFSAHAWPFEKVFDVKEDKALLPLSNSLLKFLPEGSLQELTVFTRAGKELGSFAGLYRSDKTAGVSGTRSPLTLFQYKDSKGDLREPPERLLLDSYGVRWKDAVNQPGFRLPSYRIVLK
jgi:hypothetical protein